MFVERFSSGRPGAQLLSLDDEEATACPSEEDEAMREWRQEFLEQLRCVIVRIHTNLGHPQNSTLAKMISDAGGSEEMIKCATQYPCSVCKRMSRPRLRRLVSVPRTRQFNETLFADVHFWNHRGREVVVYSMIDEATRFSRHSNSALTISSRLL